MRQLHLLGHVAQVGIDLCAEISAHSLALDVQLTAPWALPALGLLQLRLALATDEARAAAHQPCSLGKGRNAFPAKGQE